MRRHAGFSILELSVVIALMALMAGVVTVSMNGRLRAAHHDQALEVIEAIDFRARQLARSEPGAVSLVIDTAQDSLRIEVQHGHGVETTDEFVPAAGLQIERVWVLLNGRRVERKTLTIPVGTHGDSSTYGFTLRETDHEGGTTTTPLLVAGVTGQFTVFDDEDDVLDILAQAARHDAD